MDSTGIIYLFTNEAMPGLVKIGKTKGPNVERRMNELYTTGVPLPFTCAYAARVKDLDAIEKALHIAFSKDKINPRREFFDIQPEQAMVIIKLLAIEEITNKVNEETESLDDESKEALKKVKKRRPNFNFQEMGIPPKSILHFTEGQHTVTVMDERNVDLGGTEMSLTQATRTLLELDYSVAPGPYWTYNGEKLIDIYNRTY